MLPNKIEPMLADLAREPHSFSTWLYELKLDGIRCLAFKNDDQKLQGRGKLLADITSRFPEIKVDTKVDGVVLDGEIVVVDKRGVPVFNHVQRRHSTQNLLQIKALSTSLPSQYWVFDILYRNYVSIMEFSLEDRKRILAETVVENENVRILPYLVGQGEGLYHKAVMLGFEGIMAKDTRSPYRPGKRSPFWAKMKPCHRGVFWGCGFTEGKGSRETTFGAIILGEQVDGKMRYLGNVGSGLDQQSLQDWQGKAVKTECPFGKEPNVGDQVLYWFKPMPIEVVYFERTEAGSLRFPRIGKG